VTSFEVVEHVLDAALFLSAMARLAKPGGTIVVSGLCGDGFDIQVLGRRANAVFPPHHLNFLSRTGVERLVERCELELIDFLTPGKLDVDIVCNALAGDPEAVADPNLRERLMQANPEQRSAMQNQLVAEKRSSHMWIIARRPRA
jgi:threonine dehydrogenase-like Zn-dependent dehydrogenase